MSEKLSEAELEHFRIAVKDCSSDYREYMSAKTIRKFIALIDELKAEQRACDMRSLLILMYLEGFLEIPMFKRDPKETDWFITDFTREQLFGGVRMCIDIIERGYDA